jgi:hypothetical protein
MSEQPCGDGHDTYRCVQLRVRFTSRKECARTGGDSDLAAAPRPEVVVTLEERGSERGYERESVRERGVKRERAVMARGCTHLSIGVVRLECCSELDAGDAAADDEHVLGVRRVDSLVLRQERGTSSRHSDGLRLQAALGARARRDDEVVKVDATQTHVDELWRHEIDLAAHKLRRVEETGDGYPR